MFLLVCTKHCKDLVPTDSVRVDDKLAAVVLDQDEAEEKDEDTFLPYMFDLSGFTCPDNRIDEVIGLPTSNIAEYETAVREADCAPYYCVVDADTMYPIEDYIESRAYHINWAQKYN